MQYTYESGTTGERGSAPLAPELVNRSVPINGPKSFGDPAFGDPAARTAALPFVDIDVVLGRKVFTASRRLKLRYYRRLLFFKALYLFLKARDFLFELPRKAIRRLL